MDELIDSIEATLVRDHATTFVNSARENLRRLLNAASPALEPSVASRLLLTQEEAFENIIGTLAPKFEAVDEESPESDSA